MVGTDGLPEPLALELAARLLNYCDGRNTNKTISQDVVSLSSIRCDKRLWTVLAPGVGGALEANDLWREVMGDY